jgi:hypothetical protein
MPLPKKRGRPQTRSLLRPASEPKPRGRPKGRYDTAFYSPLSIGIAVALESKLLSKKELVGLLSREGIFSEGWDRSDANPFHHLNRMAKVGKETLEYHPETRRLFSKSKDTMIAFLKQLAVEYRDTSTG